MPAEIITTVPFNRINDAINWNNTISTIIQSTEVNSIKYDGLANTIDIHHQFLDIQKSFLYVCTETVFNYPHSYLSEKSYKGITTKRPFVIVGAPNSLALLQSYGFKTFNDWWDESYDSEQNHSLRILSIYNIIKDMCEKSLDDLQIMCDGMSSVLEYNFNHYQTFCQAELSKFEHDCIKNLHR